MKAPAAPVDEPIGFIHQVQGEVYIERGAERIPVIGSDRVFPGDRLVSVEGGTAEVKFSVMGAKGKALSGFLPADGAVTLPSTDGMKGDALVDVLETAGMDLSELPVEDLLDPLRTGASRVVMGALGIGTGVAAVSSAGQGAVVRTLDTTEDAVSDKPIPGLSLTEEQAQSIDARMSESPALGAASLAVLQAAAVMPSPAEGGSMQPAAAGADAAQPNLSPRSATSAATEPFRPDAAAATAVSAGTIASQTGALERVSDIAAAAPAVLGKEAPSDRIQSDISAALGAADNAIDEAEAAALLNDVAALAPSDMDALPADLAALLPAVPGEPVAGLPVSGLAPAGADEGDAFSRLMKMIEAFEAKINDLTGLVYNAFEGVGPDILVAKSEFSSLPTSELLSGLSDAVNVVTREVSTFETGRSGEAGLETVSTLVSGLDDSVSSSLDSLSGALNQSLTDISSSLSNVLNTVGNLSGANPAALTGSVSSLITDGAVDLGGALNVVSGLAGTGADAVTNLLDQVSGGAGSGGSGSGLLDGITGGGSGSGGSGSGLLDGITGGGSGSGGSGSGLLDGITGGGSGSGGSGSGLLDGITGGGSGSGGSGSGLLDGITGGGSGSGSSGSGSGGSGSGLLDGVIGGGSGGGLLGNLTNDLLEGTGGLLNTLTAGREDDASPSAARSGSESSSSRGGDDMLTSDGGTSSGMSSSAGQSPVDPNQNNPQI